ncbi:MAG TPA: hypothetical protein VFV93_06865 [Thermomicrobiales bacterium]|nr:hypothetical protein [Thermomicrobiales bacterium]
MQSALPNACDIDSRSEVNDSQCRQIDEETSTIRRWINDALDWLDRYWDDPELRSGFWHSGW